MALNKKPSAAHLAIAECEARLSKQGRSVVVITQSIDDLHRQAGSKHVLKVHGEGRRDGTTGGKKYLQTNVLLIYLFNVLSLLPSRDGIPPAGRNEEGLLWISEVNHH